jgi:hypothetical protein
VTVLAISKDTPEDSRAFAADYHLTFPLLADTDGSVSRTYAGITSDSETLPGITIIRGDGRIAFRQVATAKDDRMSSDELIATLDRTLGTTGPALEHDGFPAIDRAQLRVDLGGGTIRSAGSWRGTGAAAITGLVPLGRHLVIGPRLAFEPREAPIAIDGIAMFRAPIFNSAGAVEAGVIAGWTPSGASGANLGATADLWFAMAPTWSVQLGATFMSHDLSGASVPEVFLTLGAARLIRVR